MGQEAAQTAEKVAGNRWVERLARGGYAAAGLIHVVIGGIAAQVAFGRGGEADQSGALTSLRGAPAGPVLLWVCVVGLAMLALWYAVATATGSVPGKTRWSTAALTLVYAALTVTTFGFARGGGSDGEERTNDITAILMGLPAGRLLVAATGAVIVGVGVYHVYKGLSLKFLEDLRTSGAGAAGKAVRLVGTVGYAAKGVVLSVVGVLFAVAAVQADPDEAGGLDAALKALAGQPFGRTLLVAVAVGLVLYGLYCFARARYARMGD
ncbi:DUF1206 domain-containing protein [Ornithinimicrobium avium]|uniref:DUF1206 domain-containing protein n=1 Tax=Ornithinimicrobium avium TaxID=2283195 RepID=A0A345NT10_9MICO|nr:DUF1206 domain-containing protein [Ornithinimicrobium avium]